MKPPTAIVAGMLGFADRAAGVARKLGFGTVVWAFLSALSLGLVAAAFRNAEWTRGLARNGATAATVWPAVGTTLGATVVVGAALAFAAWRRHRRHPGTAVDWIRQLTRRFSWIAATPILFALTAPIEDTRPITTIGLCLLSGLLVAYSAYFWTTERAEGAERSRWPNLPKWMLAVCTLAFTIVILRLAFINHWTFKTNRADLGFYMSVFRHSSLGKPLACTLCVGGTHTSGHFDPILVLLSPFYLLYPYSETLLVLQTLWLASSVVPLYLLAVRATGSPRIGFVLGAAFLAHPALHGICLFDFHSLALIVPLFFWLAYFFHTERWKSYAAILVALLLCREDVSLVLFTVGIAILFSGKPRAGRVALFTMVGSLAYFVLVKKVFMLSSDPLNAGAGHEDHGYYFSGLIPKGTSTVGLAGTVLTDPFLVLSKVLTEPKVAYVLALLVPLLFMPLFGRGRIVLAYGAFLTLVATRPIASVNFHYSSLLLPLLFTLAADAFGRLVRGNFFRPELGRRLSGPVAAGILASSALVSWKLGAFVTNAAFRAGLRPQARALTPDLTARVRWLHAIAKRLPRNASIAATTPVVPHLGRIRSVYMIGQPTPPEYVILGPEKDARIRGFMEKAIASGQLVKLDALGAFTLYRNTSLKKPWLRTAE